MHNGPDIRRTAAVCAAATMLCFAVMAHAGPLDLREAANASLYDDGTHGNGEGGWTDEGLNDLFLYPALPLGANSYRGWRFNVIDPAANDGRSVIVLRGPKLGRDRPTEVTVDAGGATGRFLDVMHVASGGIRGGKGAPVADYVLRYTDGTEATLPVKAGEAIDNWWHGRDLSKLTEARKRDIAHVGENYVAGNAGFLNLVWAHRFDNPHPDKPIAAVVFRSLEKTTPVILAATISDDEKAAGSATLDWQRTDPPADYFAPVVARAERQMVRDMVIGGYVKGLRELSFIRSDLLEVRVDPSITKTALQYIGDAGEYQDPRYWAVYSDTDGDFRDGVHPSKVGRSSFERWNGTFGGFNPVFMWWHDYKLLLPRPLRPGHRYEVRVLEQAIDPALNTRLTLDYDPAVTTSKAFKINQAAYAPGANERWVYLGWWAGDMGAVDFDSVGPYEIVDERAGKVVRTGKAELRSKLDDLSIEQVWQMDISALPEGRYHVRVPGLARSETFHVGGVPLFRSYYHTMRAFFHQRCGQELKQPWTWARRPACHLETWEGGRLTTNPGYQPKPGEATKQFRGGYHDAADYDCFAYHLPATGQILIVYEARPAAFTDNQLNLPESGNGVPDLLDEAAWGLSLYRQLQREDGAVPLGRGNDCDGFAQNGFGAKPPRFGVLPPNAESTPTYAAVAAQFSRCIRPFDAALADGYQQSAIRAYDYAKANPDGPPDSPPGTKNRDSAAARAWAAAELYKTTGEARFREDFESLCGNRGARRRIEAPQTCWAYLTTDRATDAQIRQDLLEAVTSAAAQLAARTQRTAYRMGRGHGGGGWGGANPAKFTADIIPVYFITGDAKLLDAIALNADFQLGANPGSKTFITGLGYRNPTRPEISRYLYDFEQADPLNGGPPPSPTTRTVAGMGVYGIGPNPLSWYYPKEQPLWRAHRDLWGYGSETMSEFTIHQVVGPNAMLHAALWAASQTPTHSVTIPAGGLD